MTTVTKTELISVAAKLTGSSQANVKAVLDAVLEEIESATTLGEKVVIKGFGSFVQKQSAARMGRNPRTGEPIEIAASSRLTFKAAKAPK